MYYAFITVIHACITVIHECIAVHIHVYICITAYVLNALYRWSIINLICYRYALTPDIGSR